ncbi:hypothetical protein [Bradyrhizobium sp. BWA-3-5]|uniref:hypothetical protein n=1 Tax=Bradyrhizobium sp. BWA-3-5 TaxID=3080013 RepID=UPI00293EB31B|nr:hypothetical protein [Bradyrhizobium sp. BWA-3-5]WOH63674.1 hypothetical protein RX331_23510 [Bradyrhizobium sp. BWA-3-5]
MLLNEGELDWVRMLRAETVRPMTQNATGDIADHSRARLGLHPGLWDSDRSGFGQEPSSGRHSGVGRHHGTQFWIDPANRVVGLVLTQTAIIGSGPISNPIREVFYSAD